MFVEKIATGLRVDKSDICLANIGKSHGYPNLTLAQLTSGKKGELPHLSCYSFEFGGKLKVLAAFRGAKFPLFK